MSFLGLDDWNAPAAWKWRGVCFLLAAAFFLVVGVAATGSDIVATREMRAEGMCSFWTVEDVE